MGATDWQRRLRAEGFGNFFVWQDGPKAFYPEHTHRGLTAHVILEGETRLYKAGDRVDVSAGAAHSTRMGPKGCKYLVGQK